MFPGENVTILGVDHKTSKCVQKGTQGSVDRRSGTSYATPIAEGTAALLLDLVRQEVTDPRMLEEVERRSRSPGGMTAVLSAMSEDFPEGGYYHVRPRKLLNKYEPAPSEHDGAVTRKWHTLMLVLEQLK